jgi:hypothetical protein
VHAIGAFLHLASDAARSDAEVAATIEQSDPRDLLRAALPGYPPRLFRALDRAGDTVRERGYYERLGEVSRGPFGEALLDGDARLDDHRLDYYRALARMDPVVASVRSALPEALHHAEAVDPVAAFLRARGALHEADFRLPPKAGAAAVARRLWRALGRVPAPTRASPSRRLTGWCGRASNSSASARRSGIASPTRNTSRTTTTSACSTGPACA